MLKFRAATIADVGLLLAWRNDPATRMGSRRNNQFGLNEYTEEIASVIADSGKSLLIAEIDDQAVGTIRCDYGLRTEVSWTVSPEKRGLGVGNAMLREIVSREGGRLLVAEIKQSNIPSLKIATANGFVAASVHDGLIVFERHPSSHS